MLFVGAEVGCESVKNILVANMTKREVSARKLGLTIRCLFICGICNWHFAFPNKTKQALSWRNLMTNNWMIVLVVVYVTTFCFPKQDIAGVVELQINTNQLMVGLIWF